MSTSFGGFQIGGAPVNNGGYDPVQAAAMLQQLFSQYKPQSAASVIGQANAAEAALPAYLQINPLIGSTEYNTAKQQYLSDVMGPAMAQQSANDNANGVGNSSFADQRQAFLKAEGMRNADSVGLQAKQSAQQLQLAQRNSYFDGAPKLVPNTSVDDYTKSYGNFLGNQQQLGAQQAQQRQQFGGNMLGTAVNAGLNAGGALLKFAGI